MPRQRNGQSSIYQGKDGYWHGRVTVGVRDEGGPDRRHVMSRDKATIVSKVQSLEDERDNHTIGRAGDNWTTERWLTFWLEELTAPYVKDNTLAGYRVAVNHHLIPGIGKHPLKKLKPEHLERLYLRILDTTTKRGTKTKPATAHQVHRVVRTALNEAVRRGHLVKNPATLARTPRVDEEEIEPFSVDEIKRLIATARGSRNGTRWVLALAVGLRQGEALGLRWSDLNLDAQTLSINRNRLRPTYRHGCNGTCGRQRAGYCPHRVSERPTTDTTKSRSGRRLIGLPAEVCELFKAHRAAQDLERATAAQLWTDEGWIFADATGSALKPSTDWRHWKNLLTQAGIRDGRLHDARHTAATVLLILGVEPRAMMAVMGWSNTAMAGRYAHMVKPIRDDIAGRIGGLLWDSGQPL